MKLGLISDVHGNLPALERVLEEFVTRGVQNIVCCGDIIGYGPWPNECVALMRDRQIIGVQGNHDALIIGESNIDEFSSHARRAALWTRDQLLPESKEFLEKLPATHQIQDLTITHGSLRDPLWEYMLDRRVAYHNFYLLETPIGCFGHSHIPTVFRWNGGSVQGGRIAHHGELACEPAERYFINPGSVGQPRDGDWRASAAIAENTETHWHIVFFRLEYAVEETRREMQRVGLPPPLYDRLLVGA
jgi:predicted phosphodiesterase